MTIMCKVYKYVDTRKERQRKEVSVCYIIIITFVTDTSLRMQGLEKVLI